MWLLYIPPTHTLPIRGHGAHPHNMNPTIACFTITGQHTHASAALIWDRQAALIWSRQAASI